MKIPILCPFRKECKNYKKECWRCKHNIYLRVGDYLLTDDFEIKEDSSGEDINGEE